jgi:alpha-1,4-digalacturonate transport system permease protein
MPTGRFFWVIFISIWAQMGFYTLILLAGLQSIPRDMYEAADMDGANRWHEFPRHHPAAADADAAGCRRCSR